ncbi:MAG: preprotein translocase subunit SecG [Clostridia bacterium]|nr:preprotein translocase subunit SecG [Clostridia bacterium]
MQNTLIIIHVIISVVLIAVVLMQHGNQQGLSGAIAGGAETFFGKNKGRTIDAVLNKATTVIACLFVVSAIVLTVVSVKDKAADVEAVPTEATETVQVEPEAVPVDAEAAPAEAEEAPDETEEAPADAE